VQAFSYDAAHERRRAHCRRTQTAADGAFLEGSIEPTPGVSLGDMCKRLASAKAALRIASVLLWGSTASAQSLLWTATYDGGSTHGNKLVESAGAVRFDAAGNTIVGAVGGPLGQPWFVTLKYEPPGSLLWSRTAFAATHGQPWALAVGPSGESIEVGNQDGGPFGSFAAVKYDAAGVEVWSLSDNPPGFASGGATDVAVDEVGNVYIAGWAATALLNPQCLVVSKYSPAGQLLWTRQDSLPTALVGERVLMAVNANGTVAVAAKVWVRSLSVEQPRIWVLDAAGHDMWATQVSAVDGASPSALAVDASGDVILGTDSPGSLQKFNSAGVLLWSEEPPRRAAARAVLVDAAGAVTAAYGINLNYPYGPCILDRHSPAGERLWSAATFDGPSYCAALRARPGGGST
jgi:hypothetical protein